MILMSMRLMYSRILLGSAGDCRSDGKALAAFVRRVERSTEAELFALIYRHGWFSDSVLRELGDQEVLGAAGLCAMIRRWAMDTSEKLSEQCSVKTKKLLGISSRRQG